MDSMLYITLTRQEALQKRMDVVANNTANASTTGYKKESLKFENFVTEFGGINHSDDAKVVLSSPNGTFIDFEAGSIEPTGNPLDFALEGPGFFTVQNDQGETLFTKNGHFEVSDGGLLVTSNGYAVLDDGGATIAIGPDDVDLKVDPMGNITTANGPLAVLGIAEFDDLRSLEKAGESLFKTDDPANPRLETQVAQGMLEMSNVNAVMQMTDMIKVMRAYQSISTMLDNSESVKNKALSKLGTLG